MAQSLDPWCGGGGLNPCTPPPLLLLFLFASPPCSDWIYHSCRVRCRVLRCDILNCLSYKYPELKNVFLQYRNRLCNIEANYLIARYRTKRRTWLESNCNEIEISCKSLVEYKNHDASANNNIEHTMSIRIQCNWNLQSNVIKKRPLDKKQKSSKQEHVTTHMKTSAGKWKQYF